MRRIRLSRPGAVRLLVLALCGTLAVAGWFGWSWWDKTNGAGAERAQARDEALRAAEEAVTAVTTMDHRNADSDFARWRSVATGALLDEITKRHAQYSKAIVQAKARTTGQVVDSALTRLDADQGKATALVSMSVRNQRPKGSATTSRQRFRGELVHTEHGWKLKTLNIVPVPA